MADLMLRMHAVSDVENRDVNQADITQFSGTYMEIIKNGTDLRRRQ